MADAVLRTDPARGDREEQTGIFVRAQNTSGEWVSADIARLDRDSLFAWLRSRGGENLWAENVVLQLLDHKPFTPEDLAQ